jgi:hypothetical protein
VAPTFPDLDHLPRMSEKWAALIVQRAKELNVKAAATAVETVRAMLGDPVAVQQAWTQWNENAPGLIAKANVDIGTVVRDVNDYWAGSAKDDFSFYMTTGDNSVQTAISDTANALTAVAKSFGDLYSGIIATYKACVKAMADCAAALIELGGDAADAVGGNVGGNANPLQGSAAGAEAKMAGQLAKAAATALAKFAKTVGNLEEQALDTLGGDVEALMAMEQDVTKVLPPDGVPDGLSDPELFYPRPR